MNCSSEMPGYDKRLQTLPGMRLGWILVFAMIYCLFAILFYALNRIKVGHAYQAPVAGTFRGVQREKRTSFVSEGLGCSPWPWEQHPHLFSRRWFPPSFVRFWGNSEFLILSTAGQNTPCPSWGASLVWVQHCQGRNCSWSSGSWQHCSVPSRNHSLAQPCPWGRGTGRAQVAPGTPVWHNATGFG